MRSRSCGLRPAGSKRGSRCAISCRVMGWAVEMTTICRTHFSRCRGVRSVPAIDVIFGGRGEGRRRYSGASGVVRLSAVRVSGRVSGLGRLMREVAAIGYATANRHFREGRP